MLVSPPGTSVGGMGDIVPVAQRAPLFSDPISASHLATALPTCHRDTGRTGGGPTSSTAPCGPPAKPPSGRELLWEAPALGPHFQQAPSGVPSPRTKPPTPSITSELHLAPPFPVNQSFPNFPIRYHLPP